MPEVIHVLPCLLGKPNKDISDMDNVVKWDLGTGDTGEQKPAFHPFLPSILSWVFSLTFPLS